MHVFTVHQAPPWRSAATKLVPEGFSVGGAVLGPVWLFLNGAWPFATMATVALLILPWPAWPGVALLIGLFGQDARRATLAWRGWRMEGVVLGATSDQAELRWFDRPPSRVEGLR